LKEEAKDKMMDREDVNGKRSKSLNSLTLNRRLCGFYSQFEVDEEKKTVPPEY
jgi:hypothetical protein